MKILVSGSHGLVGTALERSLKLAGDEVFSLVRRAPHSESEVERSEEHTSELQSRLHLVCRLLLEKKKTTDYTTPTKTSTTPTRAITAGDPPLSPLSSLATSVIPPHPHSRTPVLLRTLPSAVTSDP